MFSKILIANRGEIAVRIIRACRELGISTVAVYSEADRNSLHVQMADQAICIGPAAPQKSYLNIQNIISTAVSTGAEAIHPGFGFLSENSKFAKICRESNITFIGPSPEAIDLMGNKSKAKETMKRAGVPVVLGSDGDVPNLDAAIKLAREIGYPVMLKASSGGGGKGIRLVYSEEELKSAFPMVKAEAKASFNDEGVYLEKFIVNPRHIEIQIAADHYGNVIYLGERDCSIQRRNQKIIEEAPSTVLTPEKRSEMGNMAVKVAKSVNYENVGTIEFLVDQDGKFYFMEMNTRIQVEHPVTEMVTGFDLVQEQIKIAFGEALSKTQDQIDIRGHSIECRINAENPEMNFIPSPGRITKLLLPGGNGVRIDSGIYQDYTILPFYDSMIAKLIVHADTRERAINKMRAALSEFKVEGIASNVAFLSKIMENENFRKGNFDTSFIKTENLI